MRLFIDTGSVAEVEEIAPWGVLAGATTNPSLLVREHGDPSTIIRRICELVGGPVSAEVVAEDAAEMVRQGRSLAALHEDIVVKVPFGEQGLRATRELSHDGLAVNMTLVFSPGQALLAAACGARYVSCFLGRLDDVAIDSTAVLASIMASLGNAGADGAEVLAASIRHPEHVVSAARLGCPVATVPGKVLRQMVRHPLTAEGIDRFNSDWRSRPELGAWMTSLTATDGEAHRGQVAELEPPVPISRAVSR